MADVDDASAEDMTLREVVERLLGPKSSFKIKDRTVKMRVYKKTFTGEYDYTVCATWRCCLSITRRSSARPIVLDLLCMLPVQL